MKPNKCIRLSYGLFEIQSPVFMSGPGSSSFKPQKQVANNTIISANQQKRAKARSSCPGRKKKVPLEIFE